MKKIKISWNTIHGKLEEIDYGNRRVYGIPKGGMIAAGFLRHATIVDSPTEADIILDDIMESGTTMKKYQDKYPDKEFCSLFQKSDYGHDSWLVFPWEADHPAEGDASINDSVLRILQYLGEDTGREGLVGTPNRVVKSWSTIFGGYDQDPKDLLTTFAANGYDELVLLKDIEFHSTCEHHMLPIYGKAHVAYIPAGKVIMGEESEDKEVIGISKLARLVDIYARRLQIQERIGDQVTAALMRYLKPKGAACIIEAKHMCMTMRGVQKQNSIMVTSSLRGNLKNNSAKQELMQLIRS